LLLGSLPIEIMEIIEMEIEFWPYFKVKAITCSKLKVKPTKLNMTTLKVYGPMYIIAIVKLEDRHLE